MGTDAITLIKNDHRLMEKLFDRLKSGQGDRRALLVEVAARLAAHSHAEELKVYPALEQADPGESGEVHHGTEEHHEAEQLLHKLMAMDTKAAGFDSALEEFVGAVKHHVEEEETELLPALQKSVDAATLQQLGAAFEEVRTKELAIAGFDATGSASSGSDDGGMSRDELYERAKEAGIAGRSSMTKEELAQALREQS
jgi:hemerythrin superfamily protein